MRLTVAIICMLVALPSFATKGLGKAAEGVREQRAKEATTAKTTLETATRDLNETLARIVSEANLGLDIAEIRIPRDLSPEKEAELAQKAVGLKEALEKDGAAALKDGKTMTRFQALVEGANEAMASRSNFESAKEAGVEGAAEIVGMIDNILNHLKAKITDAENTNDAEMLMLYNAIKEVKTASATKEDVERVQGRVNALAKTARDIINCK